MNPDLEGALAALEARSARRGSPTRHDARPVLIGIGACLLSGQESEAAEAKARLQALPPDFLAAWGEAVRDEMSMASTEHIRSVDPRHLHHPSYDLGYTVEARKELEARLRAAKMLGIPADETALAGIRGADALLEKRLGARPWE